MTSSVSSPLGAVHDNGTEPLRAIQVEEDILGTNNQIADQNRQLFLRHRMLVLNMVSSPGAGKTTLLAATLHRHAFPAAVVEGDQSTTIDAERIRATGVPVAQINTGNGCHLDAHMVEAALGALPLAAGGLDGGVLFIENVGNLICPASFDLGEACKVALLSVTEGEEKPLKYPDMFRAARLMLVTKSDLLPYVPFNLEACLANARQVNPAIQILTLSTTTGEGFQEWLDWIDTARGTAA